MAILGKPNDKIWNGFSELPYVNQPQVKAMFPKAPKYSSLASKMAAKISTRGIDLLARMLTYDPAKRITARYVPVYNDISYVMQRSVTTRVLP